jgi:hypothetical protein
LAYGGFIKKRVAGLWKYLERNIHEIIRKSARVLLGNPVSRSKKGREAGFLIGGGGRRRREVETAAPWPADVGTNKMGKRVDLDSNGEIR